MQAMIILCKLPPTMEVVAQILSQTSPSEIKTLKPDGIIKAATLLFEQKGTSHGGGGKAPQANKPSTVKCKQADPKFTQQQQQQSGSNGSGSRNAPAQGQGGHHQRGSKKVHAPKMPSLPPMSATRMAWSPLLTPVLWPTPPVPQATVLLLLIIPSRLSTWHTIWGWSPPAKQSTSSTRSSQPHPQT